MTPRWSTVARALALVLLVMFVAGCAAQKAYQRAEREMRRENLDEAVLNYSKAVALDPPHGFLYPHCSWTVWINAPKAYHSHAHATNTPTNDVPMPLSTMSQAMSIYSQKRFEDNQLPTK